MVGDKEETEEEGDGGAEREDAAEAGDCSGCEAPPRPRPPPSGADHMDGGTRSFRRGRYAGAAPCGPSCVGALFPGPAAGRKAVDASSRQLAKLAVPACCCCLVELAAASVAATAFRRGEKIDAKKPPAAARGDLKDAGRVDTDAADGSEAAAKPNPSVSPPFDSPGAAPGAAPATAPPAPPRLLSSRSRFGGGGGVLEDLEDAPDPAAAGLLLCPLRPFPAFETVPGANLIPTPGVHRAPLGAAEVEAADIGIGIAGAPPAPAGLAPKLNDGGRECGTAAGRTWGAPAGRDDDDDDEPTLNNRPPAGEGMGFTPDGGAAAGAGADAGEPKTNPGGR